MVTNNHFVLLRYHNYETLVIIDQILVIFSLSLVAVVVPIVDVSQVTESVIVVVLEILV